MSTNLVDSLSDKLDLSEAQRSKLEALDRGDSGPLAAGIHQDIEIDSSSTGYIDYQQTVTTVFPISFTATWAVVFPTQGTWEVWVYLNGALVDHKTGVQPNQKYTTKGTTGWGSTAMGVKAQWSQHTRTHVKISVDV